MKRKISALVLMLMVISMLASCGVQVPRPEIKTGEFNFSVTYELNGKTSTISGVYVCEYNGTKWALDGGSHRDWKGYIKDNKMNMDVEIGTTDDGGTIVIDLGLYPDYFMGEDVSGGLDAPAPQLTISYPYDEVGGVQIIPTEEIEEIYGAKIISFEYDAPIENTFKLFA